MTHICVSNLTTIVSNNSLSPGLRQTIIWTNAGLLLIRHLGTNFYEIVIEFDSRKSISKFWWAPTNNVLFVVFHVVTRIKESYMEQNVCRTACVNSYIECYQLPLFVELDTEIYPSASPQYQRPKSKREISLQWRHNGRDGVSNHQPHHCLVNRLFGCRSKKTSKLRVIGLCASNSPMASNAENVSIWWRHHVRKQARDNESAPYSKNMIYSRC